MRRLPKLCCWFCINLTPESPAWYSQYGLINQNQSTMHYLVHQQEMIHNTLKIHKYLYFQVSFCSFDLPSWINFISFILYSVLIIFHFSFHYGHSLLTLVALLVKFRSALSLFLSNFSCFSLSSPCTHMVKSSLPGHFSLFVLWGILNRPNSVKRKFNMKWIKNDSNSPTSKDLSWTTISLVYIMSSHTH